MTDEDHSLLHELLRITSSTAAKVDALHRRLDEQRERLNGHSVKIDEHDAALNQARGARYVLLMAATTVSTAIGWLMGKLGKFI